MSEARPETLEKLSANSSGSPRGIRRCTVTRSLVVEMKLPEPSKVIRPVRTIHPIPTYVGRRRRTSDRRFQIQNRFQHRRHANVERNAGVSAGDKVGRGELPPGFLNRAKSQAGRKHFTRRQIDAEAGNIDVDVVIHPLLPTTRIWPSTIVMPGDKVAVSPGMRFAEPGMGCWGSSKAV